MRVNQINNQQKNFTSMFRFSSYMDCNGRFRETQNTTAKRSDLDYDNLANIAKRRFSDKDKINIMPMNGSDGTESYLIAHSILKVFGEEDAMRRVFPIVVSDVDSFIINKYGKAGLVALNPDDIEAFGESFDKYFEEIPMSKLPKVSHAYSESAKAFKLTPFFKELFEFRCQDFQKRLTKVKDEGNSIALIRNCLAQSFGWAESALVINKVGNVLQDRSLFVIGGYDRSKLKDLVSTLSACDFKEVGDNIFSKKMEPIDIFSRALEAVKNLKKIKILK